MRTRKGMCFFFQNANFWPGCIFSYSFSFLNTIVLSVLASVTLQIVLVLWCVFVTSQDDYVMKHICIGMHCNFGSSAPLTERKFNRITTYSLCFTNDYAIETSAFTFAHSELYALHWQKPELRSEKWRKNGDACTKWKRTIKPTFVN